VSTSREHDGWAALVFPLVASFTVIVVPHWALAVLFVLPPVRWLVGRRSRGREDGSEAESPEVAGQDRDGYA
jgi:hypothetical protein